MSVESRQRPRKIAQYHEGESAGQRFDASMKRILAVAKPDLQRLERTEADARKTRRERKAG